jgi:1-acyl-sn-glycerol-3-phosphate acyltransferase
MQITTTSDERTASPVFRAGISALKRLSDYHQYQAIGLDGLLGQKGALLVACNHSFATYDAVLLALAGYQASGRWFHAMADRLFFRIPVVGDLFSTMGFVEGTRDTAQALLARGEVLGVLPGGMREAVKSSRHKYTVDWRDRRGFVWLSMMTGTPIALAACPRADDIFDIVDNPVTPWVYQRFKIPVALFRGRGPTPLPRPVKLWHLVSEPILPPVAPDQVTERDVEAHHAALSARMADLMHRSLRLGLS